ncbi:hypothetical protein [Chitinophaga sp.]|uniref:hypothetical protein n=1 Tax=Chitinophaga sp. TaxID=1869181 RepID=UPI002D7EB102|nr:hypothetical protein [Chitinophaga sp.]
MKTITVISLALALGMNACNGPAQNVRAIVLADDVQQTPVDTMIAIADTIQTDPIASWNSFIKYDGRYVEEACIFDTEPLKTRLGQLLGKARKSFLERFKVTPPVEIENRVLFNEGYMPGKSGTDEAAFAIDMERDIIYVGFTINKSLMLFSEKGDTDYPDKFLQWTQNR